MQSSIITSIIVIQLSSNSLQCEVIASSILLTDVIMFGRHCPHCRAAVRL